jgi:hypothetical protein
MGKRGNETIAARNGAAIFQSLPTVVFEAFAVQLSARENETKTASSNSNARSQFLFGIHTLTTRTTLTSATRRVRWMTRVGWPAMRIEIERVTT